MFDDLLKCVERERALAKRIESLNPSEEDLLFYEIVAQKMGCETLSRIIEVDEKMKEIDEMIDEAIPPEIEIQLAFVDEINRAIDAELRKRRRR